MAPKPRKPLTKKDGTVTSATDDNTSASNANNDTESIAKAAGSKKRHATTRTQRTRAKRTAILAMDVPEAKVTHHTKQTTASCTLPRGTTGRNKTKEKQLLKRGMSQRRNESEVESSAVKKTRGKRQSTTKAPSKITGHFEETPPLDSSALVKAERKIWEEIAGMQKTESGLKERKRADREPSEIRKKRRRK